ncbi:hypothetical protein BDB00DRAFT_787459 [Zychaea mexicana]|uniref:uncharacterized protein n=1 Tax=Zychaea mexicana TaxID=64656 RepID=UPI0022FF2982|nr:uncharacterized protein BDB00DRAFT_787459 [Zychaea mexicana]KAI9494019.1 hypothetical protein BDB00DRAFT_787459 [Zychaea mexicana]
MTEEARKGAVHIKYGHEVAMARDERFFYPYQGSTVRIDSILNATMGYLNGVPQHDGSEGSSSSSSMQTLGQLVQSRLDRFKHDYEAVSKQQEYTLQASSDYILMGALMHRSNYDQRQPEWELYLRDYISSENGKLWRILSELNADRNETKITSDQALADIHGEATVDEDGKTVQPSAHPREFRPVYLFYCNRTMVAETFHSTIEGSASSNTAPTSVAGQTTSNTKACNAAAASAAAAEEESGITLADYILDEDDQHYMYENPDDDKVCKVCGIDEIIEDVNNMFYCDHCNLGVHQLCEDPTIAQFETELDPWYCRECSRQKGLPMPQPKDQQALLVLPAKRSNDGQHSTMEEAKRKREERG